MYRFLPHCALSYGFMVAPAASICYNTGNYIPVCHILYMGRKIIVCAIDTCCGLHCRSCSFAQSHGCGGCIATGPVARCCLGRGLRHCGECLAFPCEQLAAYSNDPFHGDDPPGARLEQCRRWAAETTPQEVTLP